MKSFKSFLCIMILMALIWVRFAFATDDTSKKSMPPLPPKVNIVTPNPSLPPDIRAFSGKWSGRWEIRHHSGQNWHGVNAILIVEKLEPDKATVVYAWGDSPEWNITRGWERYQAVITKNNGKTILSFDSGQGLKFSINNEGRLDGSMLQRPGVFSDVEMSKIY